MDNIIFTGANNENYAKLIALISEDLNPDIIKIVVGLKNKLVLQELSNIKNLIFIDSRQFRYPKKLKHIYTKRNNFEYDNTYLELVKDSFIRLFPYYWQTEDILKSIAKFEIFWNSLIDKHKINTIVNLSSVPHYPSFLILEKIASSKNLRVINFWFTGVNGYVHLANNVYMNLIDVNHSSTQLMDNYDFNIFLRTLEGFKQNKDLSTVIPQGWKIKKNSTLDIRLLHISELIKNLGFFSTFYNLLRIRVIQNFNYLARISEIEVDYLPDRYIFSSSLST